MESAQTLTDRKNVKITLTPDEQDKLLICISSSPFLALHKKLQFLFSNSGDACRHSAQSSDAVGQGGTIYDCLNTSDCLCLKCFEALGSLGGN